MARGLGVSHTLLAHRFGSKDALWRAAVDHGFSAVALHLWALVSDPPEDDVERLRAIIVGFIEATAARPALLRIINQEAAAGGPRFDHLLEAYIGPVRDLGADVLDKLEAAGRIRPTSVGLMYFLMTHGAGGPLAFPALAAELGGAVDPTDADAVHRFAEAAADVIFEGIARY